MKAVGLIVEYNPFHNGHKLHLEKSLKKTKADLSIAVMSGNFLQRGELAVINKWKRTEMALMNGVDIVVELPSYYSNQSAEIFAEGAVNILYSLGVKDIVFGSEVGEIQELKQIAEIELSENFNSRIKENMKSGISYPNAAKKVLLEILGKENILSPNNILGLEYIKAALKKNYDINFETIKREKTGFYSNIIVENITSATNIRNFILKKDIENISKVVSEESNRILKTAIEKEEIVFLEDFYEIIKYKILSDKKTLWEIQDIETGFENRLYEACLTSNSFEEFYKNLISKRYTNSRIKRILIHTLLNTKKEFIEELRKEIPYIRVLGFNKKGREYIGSIKKDMNIPLITSLKNITADFNEFQRKILNNEIQNDNIYKIKNYYEEPKKPVVKYL